MLNDIILCAALNESLIAYIYHHNLLCVSFLIFKLASTFKVLHRYILVSLLRHNAFIVNTGSKYLNHYVQIIDFVLSVLGV